MGQYGCVIAGLGVGAVVLVVLLLARFDQPVLAAQFQPVLGSPAPPPVRTVLSSRRQAAWVLGAAGLGLAGVIPWFWSSFGLPSYLGAGTDFAAEAARYHRHVHAMFVYALVVVLPPSLVLAVANWRRLRATNGLARRPPWIRRGWANPIVGEAYRTLGRATAVKFIASGATCAWLAWALAHYRFGA